MKASQAERLLDLLLLMNVNLERVRRELERITRAVEK